MRNSTAILQQHHGALQRVICAASFMLSNTKQSTDMSTEHHAACVTDLLQ
jgi:hypothetical protein